MGDFWSKMKSGIKDGASFSATKIEEFSKIGKLKVEQFNYKKKIEETQKDLGIRIYDLVKDGKADNAGEDIAIVDFVKKIDSYEESINKLTEEIESIHNDAIEKQKKLQEEAQLRKEAEENAPKEPKQDDDDEVLGI